MKKTAYLCAMILCCTATFASAQKDNFEANRSVQPKGFADPPKSESTLMGGDTFATATVIPGLPYGDGGSTCNATDDYSPGCLGSAAPDVVYSYAPTTDGCINISLCGSSYDTAIHVYRNNLANPVACQDDSPGCGLQSDLQGVPVLAGNTYYIVVDGFATACGDYNLYVDACPPPPVCDPCPPGAIAEGEPSCFDGYVDVTNGGCNSNPPVVTRLLCEPTLTVCGTYGTYNANGSRDTDWYEFNVDAPTVITATVNGHGLTGSALAILDTNCSPGVLCGVFTPSAECATSTCSAAVAPGTYRIFVATFFDNTPCGTPYVLTLSGLTCPPVPAFRASWGTVKGLYR